MKLFFGEITNGTAHLDSEEQQHILKVLRMRDGDEIFVTDGVGNLIKGFLRLEGKKVSVETVEVRQNLPDFKRKIHIAIATTKNIDRMEFFLEKATEMGVSDVTFLLTEKTERKNINIEKLRKQSIAASKQSLRFHFPLVNDLTKFSDFIDDVVPAKTFVAHCHENLERVSIREIGNTDMLTFLIGPEGDFSEREIELLTGKGIRAVSLGSQRLRTETAGIFIAAWNYGQTF